MMPRPILKDNFNVTYRKIPVLAIGREIYIDTSLILEALEHHFPPAQGYGSLYPAGHAATYRSLIRGFASYWTDRPLFRVTTGLIPATVWRTHFGVDRANLIGHTLDAEKLARKVPQNLSGLDLQLSLLEPLFVGDGRKWIFEGDKPSAADVAVWYQLDWGEKISRGEGISDLTGGRARDGDGEGMGSVFNRERYPGLVGWFERFKDYIHDLPGTETRVERSDDAGIKKTLQTLRDTEVAERVPVLPTPAGPHRELDRRNGLVTGTEVTIAPDDTGRDSPTVGTLLAIGPEEVVIRPQKTDGAGPRVGDIFDRATEILCQLPVTSPTILGALPFQGPFDDGYLLPTVTDCRPDMVSGTAWETLLAVNHVDTIVLRLVLGIAQADLSRESGPPHSVRLLNATIYLLRVSLDLASQGRGNAQRWSVVCVFLWTSWQRILMIRLRSVVGRQLHGFDYNSRGLNSIRAQDLVPEIFEYRGKVQQADLEATPYLCAWAYRNLIEDRACISSDLRHVAQNLHDCFGGREAVCNAGHVQCSGLSSVSCGRFENTTVINQSMHMRKCSGNCPRLFWSRESFVAVSGPKAIDVTTTSASALRYCQVTSKTLAISHVWSHGQGGRPDRDGPEGTGFNLCLHQRYSEIAVSLGCSSYWMDTPCIPSEKGLRWDCIAHIHKIFTTSMVTLVCDRDLMSIDIADSSVDACENLLSTLLVCDWNMRAWTLLESMRGRSSLYLLCADDRTIKLYDVLQTVFQGGSLDVLVPYLTRSYLFPPDDIMDMELFEGSGSVATAEDQQLAEGFISVGEAAVLLSHRHATRDEDDVLIWNLLIGDTAEQDAAEMWRRQLGTKISTGALVSSAPRLRNVAGFHWAPSRPTLPRRSTTNTATTTAHEKTLLAYDGGDARDGEITTDGLRAKWLTCRFTIAGANVQEELHLGKNNSTDEKLAAIANRYIPDFAHGMLLQVCPTRGPNNVPLPYQGSNNHVLVVCGSHDALGWEWRGAYEWGRTCPLPRFVVEEILLV
ncbi:hypothetical protein A1O7_02149 [Cladophialophora yegresii CBS 114405]|uniref:DUF7962 domain-containing protein n=1 Tax=Cladophialophora yegresii CBS 114405 TaxID=1182544 RepID=W9W9P3_9EURO|nr:uncharacterized protein A1O7_02149 [Cladophialophora yegresii CBS 114405]EXJ61720.1 hypothetical protein A1O7_02149 [Cladophialophora yegresii CBS 114405]